jgi:hypothetical protein
MGMNTCDCFPGHSVTSAHQNITCDNNGTLANAYQFGTPGDFTWTLTGCSFSMDVQRNRYDQTPLLTLSTGTGTIVIDDVNQRVIHFNVPSTTLKSSLPVGLYIYDLVMTDSSTPPIRTPLMHGSLCVEQGITT